MVKSATRLNLFELQNVCIWKHARIVLAVTLIFFSGCHARTARNGEKPSSEIVVAAAANLTDAFQELSRRFSDRTGIRVILSFGGTADLAKQIENGAPFDILAAADSAHVEALEQKGLLTPGTRALYARG
ncbi:MAG: molybdate ABC transporter substrate-binding protein, partial [Terriglobia bacterium]